MSKNLIRILIVFIAAAAIAIIVVASIYTHDNAAGPKSAANNPIANSPITGDIPPPIKINTSNQPTLGDPNAPLKIVAFEDLKCVACKFYNLHIYPQIEKDYIKTRKANYTIINLAFIPDSLPAANAARCIYDQSPEAFFNFVAYVYHHQPPENENWATIPTLLNFASNIKGINQKKLTDCLIKQPYDAMFTTNMEIAQKAMGGTISTPRIYVNGVLVSPLNMTQFKRVVAKVSQ